MLKEQRLMLGITQKEMSKRLKISESSYCLIEKGLRGFNLKKAQIISEVLNIPLEDLVKCFEKGGE